MGRVEKLKAFQEIIGCIRKSVVYLEIYKKLMRESDEKNLKRGMNSIASEVVQVFPSLYGESRCIWWEIVIPADFNGERNGEPVSERTRPR